MTMKSPNLSHNPTVICPIEKSCLITKPIIVDEMDAAEEGLAPVAVVCPNAASTKIVPITLSSSNATCIPTFRTTNASGIKIQRVPAKVDL